MNNQQCCQEQKIQYVGESDTNIFVSFKQRKIIFLSTKSNLNLFVSHFCLLIVTEFNQTNFKGLQLLKIFSF